VSSQPAYHLLLDPEEVPLVTRALDLMAKDAAHEPDIRGLARAVLSRIAGGRPASGSQIGGEVLSLPLAAPEMKIVYTSVHLLLDDLQREEADEMEILHHILDKLPDEHAIRAIALE
jgi:hypothetical protein